MIAIVVGVNMFPVVTSMTQEITPDKGYSSAVSSLAGIFPIIFVTVIILGAVAWMVFDSEDGLSLPIPNFRRNRKIRNSRELMEYLDNIVQKKMLEYANNLDELLGIRTIVRKKIDEDSTGLLITSTRALNISDEFDWYIVGKNKDYNMFKIVGLHKKDASKNCVYVLGNNGEKPYLIKITDGADLPAFNPQNENDIKVYTELSNDWPKLLMSGEKN